MCECRSGVNECVYVCVGVVIMSVYVCGCRSGDNECMYVCRSGDNESLRGCVNVHDYGVC